MNFVEIEKTVKALYQSYENRDRDMAEKLIAANFYFTSPMDNGLNRKMYFEICWPSSLAIEKFEFVEFVTKDNKVFVIYSAVASGKSFRNFEMLTVNDAKISKVEVYFGWNLPDPVKSGQHSNEEF